MTGVSSNRQIHETALIAEDVTFLGDVTVEPYAVLGKLYRPWRGGPSERIATLIGPRCHIGHFSIVGMGSQLDEDVLLDDRSTLEEAVLVGPRTRVIYLAQLCNEAKIGADCVIAGLVGERSRVGDRCRVFGRLVHSQYDPSVGWDDAIEESVTLADDVFVGFGATIAGGVRVGHHSYVCAGAVVTRDVPAYHIVTGSNEIIHHSQWKGRLGESPFFKPRESPQ